MSYKVTIYEGVSKEKKNPYTAVLVEIGKWSKLVFPSEIEIDYIKKHLADGKQPETMVGSGKTILDDDEGVI